MTLFLAWLLFSGVIAAWASSKGRSGLGWLLLALIFSPLLAGLMLLVAGTGYHCSVCKEAIHKDATVCPFCRSDLAATKTDPTQEARFCPFCSVGIRGGTTVCPHCKHDLTG